MTATTRPSNRTGTHHTGTTSSIASTFTSPMILGPLSKASCTRGQDAASGGVPTRSSLTIVERLLGRI